MHVGSREISGNLRGAFQDHRDWELREKWGANPVGDVPLHSFRRSSSTNPAHFSSAARFSGIHACRTYTEVTSVSLCPNTRRIVSFEIPSVAMWVAAERRRSLGLQPVTLEAVVIVAAALLNPDTGVLPLVENT